MKIIQICAAYKPAYVYGGPTMSVSKLSEELVKAGQDVTVLTTTANGKTELDVPTGKPQLVDGVKVYYFKRLTKDHTHFSPALFWFLHKEIKKAKRSQCNTQCAMRNTPNLIIHIHAWWNLVSIFSCLVAKLHGVKVILSPRGMLTNYSLNNRNSKFKDAIHFLLGKRLLNYCHIHATSSKEQKDIQQICGANNISVIPNFVRFPKHTLVKDGVFNQSKKYRLLFLSRIEEKKGLELFFNALSKLTISYQLSIAGTGDTAYIQNLQSLATRLNIQQNIQWLGHIENHDKFELIAQHDLLVLTSYNENFANVIIESLAMGISVLVSSEVGLSDYVAKNNLGWVVALDIEEIAKEIEASYINNTKRAMIKSKAPTLIQYDFDDKKLTLEYINLYKSLI